MVASRPGGAAEPTVGVFALREEDPDDVAARSEPILLVVWMAGAAAVLATPTAGALLDKPDYDAALVAVWAFVAGGLYGAVGYFLLGFGLYFGTRLPRSLGSFAANGRSSASPSYRSHFRSSSCFRCVALYGGDAFRGGGADEGAARRRCSPSSSDSSRGRSCSS